MTRVPGGLSVVIPVLDESLRIGRRLCELGTAAGIDEVIVVDGGSRDDTAALARAAGAQVLQTARGRGPQMNAGAAAARGAVLLFLHADVALPPDAAARIAAALVDASVVGGAFRTWTVADTGRNWLGPLLHLADLRSRITRLPYGDQAIFVRREAFVAAGGFPAQPLMEDVELARRLRAQGRLVTVPASVRVSGRRFLASPLRAMVSMRLLPLLYRAGVAPERLARVYGDPR